MRERLLLLLGEALGDGLYEPALTLAALGLERLSSLIGELEQSAASVGGVGPATDQPIGFEFADGLGHRLRTNTFGGGQVAGTDGAFTVEAAKHSTMRQREAMLGSQAPYQLTNHNPQFAGYEGDIDGHSQETIPRTQVSCTGYLYNVVSAWIDKRR